MKNQEEKRLPDKLADGLSGIMIIICVIIFAVMVFAVSYGVIGRYIPFIKTQDGPRNWRFCVWYGFAFLVLVTESKKGFM